MFGRWSGSLWKARFSAAYVHLIFGARQTGKSTLLRSLVDDAALWLDFSRPGDRVEYLRNPDLLVQRCLALPKSRKRQTIVVDEAQNVPPIFDAVQHLYDLDKRRWRFILCGSSARRLRSMGANLLPGRSLLHRLYPLITLERPPTSSGARDARKVLLPELGRRPISEPRFPHADIIDRLIYGELPGIAVAPRAQRADLLRTYTLVYLEEELRRESLVKNWPAFARFLQLAAQESGQMINYAGIAREASVSVPTVKSYYQLLEDMFIGFRVTALSGSPRKSLLSTERFFFFDVGVRNAAAELPLETAMVRANPGPIFEQWVGIELWKRLQYLGTGKLHYQRSKSGAEVDFIIAQRDRLIPIEVKWTERPTLSDARHLVAFIRDHPARAPAGFIICRCPAPLALSAEVMALPWTEF